MLTLQVHPKNYDYFTRLIDFGKECQAICKEHGIEPVIYGSVAYLFYTKDHSIDVNDIDFLVPESAFDVLGNQFTKLKLKHETTTYHSLKVFKNNIKISFDAIDHYLQGISEQAFPVNIEGSNFKVLNPESLKSVYRQGAENIPAKKEAYTYKLNNLVKISK